PQFLPAGGSSLLVHAHVASLTRQHDAINGRNTLPGNPAFPIVAQNKLGIALQRVAVSASSAAFRNDRLARLDQKFTPIRKLDYFAALAPKFHQCRCTGSAASNASGRKLASRCTDGKAHRVSAHHEHAISTGPALLPTRTAAVLADSQRLHEDRLLLLDDFDTGLPKDALGGCAAICHPAVVPR